METPRTRSLLVAGLALAALAPAGLAQGDDEAGLPLDTAPKPRRYVDPHADARVAFGAAISEVVGAPAETPWIVAAMALGGPPPPEVRLDAHVDGLEVTGAVYASADDAVSAGSHMPGPGATLYVKTDLGGDGPDDPTPRLGQVRGRAYVQVRGGRIGDAAFARRLLDAAFAALPGGDAEAPRHLAWVSPGVYREVVAVYAYPEASRWRTDRDFGKRADLLRMFDSLRRDGTTGYRVEPDALEWLGERAIRGRFAPSDVEMLVSADDAQVAFAITGPGVIPRAKARYADLFPDLPYPALPGDDAGTAPQDDAQGLAGAVQGTR